MKPLPIIDKLLYDSCDVYVNTYIRSRIAKIVKSPCYGDPNILELCAKCKFYIKYPQNTR